MRTFDVTIGGQAFVLKAMSARQFIAVQRGDKDEASLVEMLADSAVKHPFGEGPDAFLDGCDLGTALELLKAWAARQTDAANPKASASDSPEHSQPQA
jgi:hypothetical protein